MENQIILSKESSDNDIRRYFEAVLKLSQSDNEFPINLDEVWMLVYNRKDYATDALKKDFIEDVDYITTSVKTEVGSNKIEYRLTVSCMEFFIARKVRPVFEVYRKVFHKSVEVVKQIRNENQQEQKPASLNDKMKTATWAAKFLNMNDNSKLILAKPILEQVGLPIPDYTPSKGVLSSAKELLAKRNIIHNGKRLTTKVLNEILERNGIIRTLTRKTSKGQDKPFKNITEKGSVYGENQVSQYDARETQPLWFVEKFDELLKAVGLQPQSELF